MSTASDQFIVGFLKDLQSGSEPANRCKLMFVGQGTHNLLFLFFSFFSLICIFLPPFLTFFYTENVGKTTLMNRLIGKKPKTAFFSKSSSNNISTDGVDLNQWISEGDSEDGSRQKIYFSTWDFAGQGIIMKFI